MKLKLSGNEIKIETHLFELKAGIKKIETEM